MVRYYCTVGTRNTSICENAIHSLTLRVTVGSLWALEMRCPNRVLVLRKCRRMFVALVKSLSTGE
jgi:hypothetical protein